MSGARRGFFREALVRLRSLAEAADEADEGAARPQFVPPPTAEAGGAGAARRRVLRPPGALAEEAAFLAACTRCGACLAVCPEGTLVAGTDGYPQARVATHPCVMCADMPCAVACEPGALAVARGFAIATARVYAKLCLNHGYREDEESDEAPCERCVDWCPVPGAIALGAGALPLVDGARCTGCGLCAAHCAAYPQAITLR